ncbi:MAG: DUF177 domain-containing protein [Salinivirgaceae bacterium]|nr:DUF177 domain-containing protein [Salinivirgaceae bacterium]
MDYNIPFRGLDEGKYQYQYSVDDSFFDAFPEGDIRKGQLTAQVDLLKRSTGLESDFKISGFVIVECDRCLDEFELPIEYEGKLYFEYGEESEELTEELVRLSGAENYLDAAKYISEFINLSVPIQKFHPEDENGKSLCNKEMLNRINKASIKEEDEIDDPRWDKLRDLIN